MGSGQGCLMAAAVNWKAILLESMEVDTETGCWVWTKRVNKTDMRLPTSAEVRDSSTAFQLRFLLVRSRRA